MKRTLLYFALLFFPTLTQATDCSNNIHFKIGTGVYDITGPAAEEGMMGYGMINQRTAGIYQRLWARAFVIQSPCNKKQIAFVNVDLGQVFQGIKQQVIKKLKTQSDQFDESNVLITATHTHSGPGGYSTYAFYNLSTLGFDRKNFNTIVNGIVHAIQRAQANLTDGTIKIATGSLTQIGHNRSPSAYLLNSKMERDHYSNDVDQEMTLIRFDDLNGHPLGIINWFPLHGVSMNNKNHLIVGDNKGYAEYQFEKDFHSDYGPKAFVAAFAQANAGDVSPNEYQQEGKSDLAGLKAIEKAGLPQYQTAKNLFAHANKQLIGKIDYRHTFVAMDDILIAPDFTDGLFRNTCPAAIGVSMLAGTQDGEGIGKQGINCQDLNKWISYITCKTITTECQGIKPIVLETGTIKPYPWTPNILPLQIFQVGKLIIVAVPFELTTMSGRRIREVVAKQFPDNVIVLSTLANAYAGYVTTNEEYQAQRYEGASTHFGPWTQAALSQEYSKLAKALRTDLPTPAGPNPSDLSDKQIKLQPGVVLDSIPRGKYFGDIVQDVQKNYSVGDIVKVIFWGAHPNNNYRIQNSFLAIQYFENDQWKNVKLDRDWETEYHWHRNGIANSKVMIVWRIPKDTLPGYYRIAHYGNAKLSNRKIINYSGYSSVFKIKGQLIQPAYY